VDAASSRNLNTAKVSNQAINQEGKARRAVEAVVTEDEGTEEDATVVVTEDVGRKTTRLC
jgi:hypothetical protein